MNLGERLHLIRRRRDLTQQALATLVGLDRNTIAGLEQGRIKDLGGRALGRLADALGTTTDYLLGRTDESGVESDVVPATAEEGERNPAVAASDAALCRSPAISLAERSLERYATGDDREENDSPTSGRSAEGTAALGAGRAGHPGGALGTGTAAAPSAGRAPRRGGRVT